MEFFVSFRNYNWWWVPIVGPHLGAIAGIWMYMIFVGAHWELEEDTVTKDNKSPKSEIMKSIGIQ